MEPSRLIPSTETAAFLVHEGLPVRGCCPNGRGCGFLFDDTPTLHEHLLRFTNGQGTVEPRAYLRALHDLRDLARSQLAQGDTRSERESHATPSR